MKTALLAGATGLIGSQLLSLLLESDRYEKVIAISRRSLKTADPKLHNIVSGLDTLPNFTDKLLADDVYCCLGTTIRKAKTKGAFRQIDFEYPVLLASLSKAQGAKQFLLVSSLGADKSSFAFYNRIKGETEEAIVAVGFESCHIFRPSLLQGPRKEHRAGEDAAKWFFAIFGFLVPIKYKAIESIKVARAMLACAALEQKGNFIHDSGELQTYTADTYDLMISLMKVDR